MTDKGEKKKGKKKAGGIVKRPVICICNDIYVPALRPLRQIAFTLHFPPTATARFVINYNHYLIEFFKLHFTKLEGYIFTDYKIIIL